MTKMCFEDFISAEISEDIFGKTARLYNFLHDSAHDESIFSGSGTSAALGHATFSGPGTSAAMRNKDGLERRVFMLGSNSYLDLTRHPDVIAASRNALEKYGYGMGAVSLYGGISDLHRELEERIAAFTKTEDAILFPSGYGTNIGVISSLCHKGDVIINDSANHASIFDGCALSGADVRIYPHGNMKRLEQVLAKLPPHQKGRLIITDGVFSMHGDLAPLDEIARLARKYEARLMVDDAHGLGVVGPTGRGTVEVFDAFDDVDLQISMLSKAPGGLGGYCAGKKEVIDYLRLYARTYFFSTATPAPLVAGLIEVFKLMEADRAGRTQLWENISYLHSAILKLGFTTNDGASGIIPIIVGDEDKLACFHAALFRAGVYTNIVTYPAVRRKECRLRLCAMATFTKAEMDAALHILTEEGRKCGII